VTIAAGLFLCVFGGLGAWFLSKRYPSARFLRYGYVLMAAGGLAFAAWAIWKALVVGVAAAALLALGGALGAWGALRRELRLTL